MASTTRRRTANERTAGSCTSVACALETTPCFDAARRSRTLQEGIDGAMVSRRSRLIRDQGRTFHQFLCFLPGQCWAKSQAGKCSTSLQARKESQVWHQSFADSALTLWNCISFDLRTMICPTLPGKLSISAGSRKVSSLQSWQAHPAVHSQGQYGQTSRVLLLSEVLIFQVGFPGSSDQGSETPGWAPDYPILQCGQWWHRSSHIHQPWP